MMGSLGLYLETADIRSWGRGKLAARRWPAKVLSDLWKYVLGSQSVAKYVLWLSWGSQSVAKYVLWRSWGSQNVAKDEVWHSWGSIFWMGRLANLRGQQGPL